MHAKRRFLTAAVAAMAAYAAGAEAQTFRIGYQADPDTLDPVLANTVASRLVFGALCDKLVDIDAGLKFVPQLAQSWSWNDANTAITFKLRPDVVFHDGEKLDAAAVKFNIERALNHPESRRKSEINAITSVEVVDPLTVRFNTATPFAPLLAQLADRAGMMVSPKAVQAAGDRFAANPVCSGPFKFTERVAQDRIVLDRFAQYWNKDRIHLNRVVFLPIADTTVRLNNLRAGTVELIESVQATDMATIRGDNRLQLVVAPGLGHTNIIVNIGNTAAANNPLGRDPRVRQALDLALDRDTINRVAFEGANLAGFQPQPPGNPYFNKALPAPKRDVARARQLLAEAGVPRFSFELMLPTITEFRTVAEIVQSMAAEAGFDIKLKTTELATSLQLAREGNFQAFLISWSGRVDPDANMYPFLHSKGAINDGRYANAEVDSLLDRARSTNALEDRLAAYEKVARTITNERPRIYVFHENRRFAMLKSVDGFVGVPDGMIRFTDLKLKP